MYLPDWFIQTNIWHLYSYEINLKKYFIQVSNKIEVMGQKINKICEHSFCFNIITQWPLHRRDYAGTKEAISGVDHYNDHE